MLMFFNASNAPTVDGVMTFLTDISRMYTTRSKTFNVTIRGNSAPRYNIWIWYSSPPYLFSQQNVINHATKQVNGIGKLSPEPRNYICNLPSLESRRNRGRALEVYKILNHISGLNSNIMSIIDHGIQTRSNYRGNLSHNGQRSNLPVYSFQSLAPKISNDLKLSTRTSGSPEAFKINYDRDQTWTKTK